MNQNKKILFYVAGVIIIIVLGGFGYFFIQRYVLSGTPSEVGQNISNEDSDKNTREIEQLRQEVEDLKSKQSQSQNSCSPPATQQKEDSVVADPDIDDFLTAVGQLICFNPDNNEKNIGSGFLWRESNTFSVFTNRHVFEGKKNCLFVINHTPTDQKRWGTYYLDVSTYYQWNSRTDFGFFI